MLKRAAIAAERAGEGRAAHSVSAYAAPEGWTIAAIAPAAEWSLNAIGNTIVMFENDQPLPPPSVTKRKPSAAVPYAVAIAAGAAVALLVV